MGNLFEPKRQRTESRVSKAFQMMEEIDSNFHFGGERFSKQESDPWIA